MGTPNRDSASTTEPANEPLLGDAGRVVSGPVVSKQAHEVRLDVLEGHLVVSGVGFPLEPGKTSYTAERRNPALADVESQRVGDGVSADETRGLLADKTGRGSGTTSTKTENLAELEIRSLLWIKKPGNEVFSEALQAWEAKDTLFATRIERKKKQSSDLRNEIYQLIGFYSVFQGVLLTAVAQSNLLTCHNWWTAFLLCVLASAVTAAGVGQKYRAIWALEKTIAGEEYSRKECINRIQRLKQQREKFSFEKHAKDSDKEVAGKSGLKVGNVSKLLARMVSTMIVNRTPVDFRLKEGNAGVYRNVAILKGMENGRTSPHGQYKVVVDTNATYREYTLMAQGTKGKVLITSDLCQANSVINIIEKPGKLYDTQPVPRNNLNGGNKEDKGGQIPTNGSLPESTAEASKGGETPAIGSLPKSTAWVSKGCLIL